MKTLKIIFIILVVFALAVVAVGCTTSGGAVTDMGRYDNAELYSAGDFTYNASDVDKVEVDWVLGSVTVSESGEDVLSINESGSASLKDEQKLHWRLDGRTLKVKFWQSGYSTIDDVSELKNLVIEVPTNIELDIETVSATITSGDLNMGEVDFGTVSGNINCNKITALNSVDLQTISGVIATGEVIAQKIDAQTTSGNISVHAKRATEVDIETTSGVCKLAIENVPAVEVETVSGNVDISIAGGANVQYNTVSGEFSTPMTHTKDGNNYVFGDGACRIEVKTTSGNLAIK